jgi:hypothetical protein
MNDLLQLKGTFEKRENRSGFGARNVPSQESVSISHLEELLRELQQVLTYWKDKKLISGVLLSIEYNQITAKSNRVRGFLSKKHIEPNDSIVGAKFTESNNPNHVITHFINIDVLNETITCLNDVIDISQELFKSGIVTCNDIKNIHQNKITITSKNITKSRFIDYVVDSYYVNKFYVDENVDIPNETSIVTIFDTKTDTIELMKKLGIIISKGNMIEDTTISLTPDQLSLLKQQAPYLISMATTDISDLTNDDFEKSMPSTIDSIIIPTPTTEPIIGVIDTMFDTRVYFSNWVDFKNMLSPDIELTDKDHIHGTSVSSIIVDGPNINPDLDDGCGRFRVRHFGVAVGGKFSSFSILKSIQQIVASNRDIKVWNLSLGSALEVNRNSISPEAAILDKIQHENDVIFIIAGTNKNANDNEKKRIGAPADSINSLVVNSVNIHGNPASYTRVGPVLSFFNKPDISYFGGDSGRKIKVCTPTGEQYTDGTSYAAPWITRKMAYLIHILGLSREAAKALLIDAASGWHQNSHPFNEIGYGIVPTNINDIVKSNDDEIKFILSDTSEKYTAYNYNIPIPTDNNQHPYIARVTLCYFPHCLRNQGVDYTSTEFNVKFGRIKRVKDKDGNDKEEIQSINGDEQDNIGSYITEKTGRGSYRKWDNTKHIRESFTGKNKAKKAYQNKMWGISITSKERIRERHGQGVNFGIVITVKEIKGVNRIEDFIQQSLLKGWLVNRINVEQRIDIYNSAEEYVVFDDNNK